jgi:hypothetical protein
MKRLPIFFLWCLMIVAGAPAVAPAEMAAAPLKITEMAVTTKIVRGNPIDSVRRICFTRLTSETGKETFIKHVWYSDGVKVAEYQLPVKGEKWRTYSKKAVEKGLSGDWRVDALDSEGKLLKSVQFRMN